MAPLSSPSQRATRSAAMARSAPRGRAGALLLALCCFSSGGGAGVAAAEAEADVAKDLFAAANAHFTAKQYVEARPLYREATDKYNHSGSQCQIGELHYHGNGGFVVDKGAAAKWYALSSNQEYPRAQARLGLMLLRGDGVPMGENQALELLGRAAAQGESTGQSNLGLMHRSGLGGLAASPPAGLAWYLKAAKQGHADAQYNAGVVFSAVDGGGVPRDDESALVWYRLAAEGGNAYAKESLPRAQSRCMGACGDRAEVRIKAFKVQDACRASLFNRSNLCSDRGDPTPM